MKEFHIGTQIYFGESALDRLSELKFESVIILADPFVVTSGLVEHVTKRLDAAHIRYTLFTDIVPDPPVDKVIAGVAAVLKGHYPCMIAVGGGSAIDTAKAVIEDLIGHGYVTGRVDPGFVFVEINDTMTAMMYRVNELGLYISSTREGSDAQKAGFKSGDYVVKVDGKEVSTEAEANARIDGKKVGDSLTVIVKRNGQEKTITLTLSEYTPEKENENQTTSTLFDNPFFN